MSRPTVQQRDASYYVVRLDSYFGQETAMNCMDVAGEQCTERDFLFCVIRVGRDGAEVSDYGYRTIEEARHAWPEAIRPRIFRAQTDLP